MRYRLARTQRWPRGHLADQQEQCGIAGLQRLRHIPFDHTKEAALREALAAHAAASPAASAHRRGIEAHALARLIWLSACWLALFGLSFAAAAQSTPPSPPSDTSSDDDATALAKKLQNPIGDLYSFPFQNNTNFNTGPNKGTQDILNVQPVIPIHINEDWNIITRTILPLIWQPSLQPAQTVPFGTGPTTFSAFLSPNEPTNGWLWGIGPVIQVPTISNKSLGSNVWGGGPTGVLVYMKGPWVAGVLANNVWSFGGTSGLARHALQHVPDTAFRQLQFWRGMVCRSSPIITANWLTSGNKAWTLPVGAQVGRVVKIGGKLPVNLAVGAYYNALRPQFGSTWQLRTQVTLIF